MNDLAILLLCGMILVLLGIWFTLFKARGELNQSREKLTSELSEIRKLLEKKADKA